MRVSGKGKESCDSIVSQAFIMLVQLEGGVGGTDREADSRLLTSTTETWGGSSISHCVCSFKTTSAVHIFHPLPPPPFWEPNHTHMTKYNSEHTLSVATKPPGVFTELHPKAPSKEPQYSTRFTGLWKGATLWSCYCLHPAVSPTRRLRGKGKLAFQVRSNGTFHFLLLQ